MDNNPPKTSKATMLYDGACPLCQREVAHYQKMDKNNCVDWVDISKMPDQLTKYGVDYHTAMERLHVIDKHGCMQSGVQAFLTVWNTLPYYRWLATVIQFLHLTPVLDRAYIRFARWRLSSRGISDNTIK